MISKTIVIAIMVCFIMLSGVSIYSANAKIDIDEINAPVVIELFTSQSCSSCPAADRVLKELSKNSNVIPISYHVTYWNHLSWEDTLSQDFATQRQRNYSNFMNSNRVYTPQMIVNGVSEFVGSNRLKANNAIANTSPVKAITLNRDNNQLRITLPEMISGDYVLWVVGTKSHHTENIKRGENRGRAVDYTSAAINFDSLGRWDGTAKIEIVDIIKDDTIDGYTIFAQDKSYGRIVAAGKYKM